MLPDETSIIDDTNVTTVESDNGSAPLSQQPQPQQSQGRQGEEPVLQLNGEHLPQTAESGEGQESADSINNNNLPSGVLPPLPSQHTDETKVLRNWHKPKDVYLASRTLIISFCPLDEIENVQNSDIEYLFIVGIL